MSNLINYFVNINNKVLFDRLGHNYSSSTSPVE